MIPMLSVLLLFFFLPESPRWQISVGRNEQALKTIRKAERFNKVMIEANQHKVSPNLG